MAHCTPADQVEDLQERCYKYSQKALGFETCTFVASCFAAPVVSSTGSITTLIVAAAGLLVAISIELFSLMKKSNTKLLGRGLVYLSSSLLILTTFLMFISCIRQAVCLWHPLRSAADRRCRPLSAQNVACWSAR